MIGQISKRPGDYIRAVAGWNTSHLDIFFLKNDKHY